MQKETLRIMKTVPGKRQARKSLTLLLALFILAAALPAGAARAQIAPVLKSEDTLPRRPSGPSPFRIETLAVGSDAQLLTVFGSLDGLKANGGSTAPGAAEVPLVSVLRDTLGDADPENDRLRYVWMLTYTRPTALQRVASAVPFLYGRVGGKKKASTKGVPPPVIDLADPKSDIWQRFMWLALQNVVFNPYGLAAKASTSALRRNSEGYRQAHIMRALAILSLYESETGSESAFTPAESSEIQARLMLTGKTFGGLIDDSYLDEVLRRQNTQLLDTRGHNWELLRQRAEAEGLYFEPLQMPDGSATHALVWVAREDVEKNRGRKFGSRFLNIRNPWSDSRLARWDGHTETRYVDAEGRPVVEGTEGARKVELIPLALYGLDFPKIPALLVDFRDRLNPKKREMSHRVIEDVARNVLSLSRYGDVHYFLGRTVFDFVTGRRGIDVNQPTRLRAYSQLKLLLALDRTLDRDLREEIAATDRERLAQPFGERPRSRGAARAPAVRGARRLGQRGEGAARAARPRPARGDGAARTRQGWARRLPPRQHPQPRPLQAPRVGRARRGAADARRRAAARLPQEVPSGGRALDAGRRGRLERRGRAAEPALRRRGRYARRRGRGARRRQNLRADQRRRDAPALPRLSLPHQ